MKLTATHLATIAGGRLDAGEQANVASILAGLDTFGDGAGLTLPHRLAQYVPQIAHESGRFRYDREVWGPTRAQKGYEGRKDLGNTQPGDGSKFRGHTPMQISGRDNTTAFRDWCRKMFPHLDVPDFVARPELMNTDPWEGLGPIWYWDVGNPERRSLNRYADTGNNEMITRRINGGTNGLADRLELYTRTALVFLGYTLKKGVVADFQDDRNIDPDDIAGPVTRAALHDALVLQSRLRGDPVPSVKPIAPESAPSGPNIGAAVAKLRGALADLGA